jgi:hypothetical protein
MDHIGIDVHKKDSQICVLSQEGELIERRVRTEPQRFAEVLGSRPRGRVLIESATESEWVARCLEALGRATREAPEALATRKPPLAVLARGLAPPQIRGSRSTV